jgi:hypothetical protein
MLSSLVGDGLDRPRLLNLCLLQWEFALCMNSRASECKQVRIVSLKKHNRVGAKSAFYISDNKLGHLSARKP